MGIRRFGLGIVGGWGGIGTFEVGVLVMMMEGCLLASRGRIV